MEHKCEDCGAKMCEDCGTPLFDITRNDKIREFNAFFFKNKYEIAKKSMLLMYGEEGNEDDWNLENCGFFTGALESVLAIGSPIDFFNKGVSQEACGIEYRNTDTLKDFLKTNLDKN